MTGIAITEMEPGSFGIQVEEGDLTTSHRVSISSGFVDDLQLAEVDPVRIVRESVGFLLERVPATSLPPAMSLDDIGRDYPEYYDELRARLVAS
jgi:hypothetical protein